MEDQLHKIEANLAKSETEENKEDRYEAVFDTEEMQQKAAAAHEEDSRRIAEIKGELGIDKSPEAKRREVELKEGIETVKANMRFVASSFVDIATELRRRDGQRFTQIGRVGNFVTVAEEMENFSMNLSTDDLGKSLETLKKFNSLVELSGRALQSLSADNYRGQIKEDGASLTRLKGGFEKMKVNVGFLQTFGRNAKQTEFTDLNEGLSKLSNIADRGAIFLGKIKAQVVRYGDGR
ncbi:MAG: hypothetical protein WC761_04705 [Candidatus Paceibacterota bacterium]|jgi:hypothetical protein